LIRLEQIGFWQGFSALFAGARSLVRLTRTWPHALVPAAVFLVLEAAFVAVALQFLQPWVQGRLSGDGWLQTHGALLASWVAVFVLAALGWLLSAMLTPVLSAPALERIVTIVEEDLRAPARKALGFFSELWCGLRSVLLSAAFTVPVLLGLTLLELVFAPVAVVTTPLKLLIGAFGVAWGLFDYPLTLRGVGARQRLGFMRRHASVVLGFGTAFALLFWLPCCGTLMLPVGVVAATSLFWKIQNTGESGITLS